MRFLRYSDPVRLSRDSGVMHREVREERLTVLFSDVRDFTSLSEGMSPSDVMCFLNELFEGMEPCITSRGGTIDKYVGDAILAVFERAEDALAASLDMLRALDAHNQGRAFVGLAPVRLGIGLNSGIVAVGPLGGPRHSTPTVIGDVVNLGARLEAATKGYGASLIIGEHTLYGVHHHLKAVRFLDRIRVKGKQHPESLYEVFEADPPRVRAGKLETRRKFEEALAYYHLQEIDRAVPLLEACVATVPEDRAAQVYLNRCHEYRITGAHHGTGELNQKLAWSERLSLGVGEIDDQHRELLRRINALQDELQSRDPKSRAAVMDFVAEYAVEHFASEERLMEQHGYPLLAEHRLEHRAFGEFFQQLRHEIDAGDHDPLYLEFRVQLFLMDWFVHHISRADRHFSRHLMAQAARGPESGDTARITRSPRPSSRCGD